MKKSIVIVLVLVIALSIVSIIPVTQNKTINISATFDNTILQIIHVENWKNWYPELKEAYKQDPSHYSFTKDTLQKTDTLVTPGKKFAIHVISAMSYQVSETNNYGTDQFAFSIFPGDSAGIMKINLINKAPLLFTLFGKIDAGEKAIGGLKSYLEDPKAFYGFDIERSKIRDSVIATSKTYRISGKNLFPTIQNLYMRLSQYVKDHNLTKTAHASISYIPLTGDSLKITVGIPVNKLGPPDKEINCLLLPARGNVLVGIYEGPFSDRKKIYNAMAKYMVDHSFGSPAIPFERYLNDSIPRSDSSIIRIELNYPVY